MVLLIIEKTFRRDGDVFCVREAELAGAVGAEGVEGHDAFSLFLGGGGVGCLCLFLCWEDQLVNNVSR